MKSAQELALELAEMTDRYLVALKQENTHFIIFTVDTKTGDTGITSSIKNTRTIAGLLGIFLASFQEDRVMQTEHIIEKGH